MISSREVAMLFVHEGNSPKTQWPLTQKNHVIGRDAESDIQIDERQVSRQHAEIAYTPQVYTLRDLGSKNGTFMNGQAISQEPQPIRDGDEIGIALCARLTFVAEDATAPRVVVSRQERGIKMDGEAKRVRVK